MKKLNTILAAINMSAFDDEVIKRAVFIAKETRAQLHIIYAIEISLMDIEISLDSFKKKIDENDIKKKIGQQLSSIEESAEVDSYIHIAVGNAEEQVIHLAKKVRADFIILGSHSKVKIEDYYFGSFENNIAKKSALAVLVIKNSAFKNYRSILVPTDLSKPSKEVILFAKTTFKNSKMKLLFAYENLDDFEIDYLDSDKDNISLGRPQISIFKEDIHIKEIEMLKCSTSIEKDLLRYIKTTDSDLLVVGSAGTDIAGSYFSSTANFLLRNSQLDILIYISD